LDGREQTSKNATAKKPHHDHTIAGTLRRRRNSPRVEQPVLSEENRLSGRDFMATNGQHDD